MRLIALVFAVVFVSLPLSKGCGKPKSEPFKKIEGRWSLSGTEGEGDHAMSWYISYTFKKDSFFMDGYPPIYNSGTLELLEERGDSLYVKMISDPEGEYARDPHDTWIYVNGDELTFDGKTLTKEGHHAD